MTSEIKTNLFVIVVICVFWGWIAAHWAGLKCVAVESAASMAEVCSQPAGSIPPHMLLRLLNLMQATTRNFFQ